MGAWDFVKSAASKATSLAGKAVRYSLGTPVAVAMEIFNAGDNIANAYSAFKDGDPKKGFNELGAAVAKSAGFVGGVMVAMAATAAVGAAAVAVGVTAPAWMTAGAIGFGVAALGTAAVVGAGMLGSWALDSLREKATGYESTGTPMSTAIAKLALKGIDKGLALAGFGETPTNTQQPAAAPVESAPVESTPAGPARDNKSSPPAVSRAPSDRRQSYAELQRPAQASVAQSAPRRDEPATAEPAPAAAALPPAGTPAVVHKQVATAQTGTHTPGKIPPMVRPPLDPMKR
jgi:hypothetical protein